NAGGLSRRIIDLAATWLFAPTATARDNLLREHLPEKRIVVTGNTVIDALFDTIALLSQTEELRREAQSALPAIPPGKPLVLVTGHRRENFGDGMERICQAILQLVHVDPDLTVVYPVHLNPHVRKPVMALLSGHPRIHLIEPLDYPSFVLLMQQATLILTDSGGIQEEAPSIGKPVLVMREVTERPEAVQAGTVQLVGTDVERIVTAAQALLADPQARERYARQQNPYGDGRASERIISTLFGAPES
ncbi:MAG: UDP-N-acetylglucosamine 2-epimerase (non-hydrolyzing), partial [Rectinema sp.]|nr:UDP-N-acetylglucosamine 2-epimerase (non-hydrolyzing) [Rectinema sp.]